MLVLSRKNDESVVVGGGDCFEEIVRVTVLEISGGNVRLGFEASRTVPVHREEVWERICATSRRDPPLASTAGKVLSGGEKGTGCGQSEGDGGPSNEHAMDRFLSGGSMI